MGLKKKTDLPLLVINEFLWHHSLQKRQKSPTFYHGHLCKWKFELINYFFLRFSTIYQVNTKAPQSESSHRRKLAQRASYWLPMAIKYINYGKLLETFGLAKHRRRDKLWKL
jgi:hypothetical protein